MSDDSTRSTDGEHADDDNARQHRAAELTAQAQALFSAGVAPDAEADDEDGAAEIEDEDGAAENEDGAADVEDEAHEADETSSDVGQGIPADWDDAEEADVPVVAVMSEGPVDDQAPTASGAPQDGSGDDSRSETEMGEEPADEDAPSFPSFGVVFQAPDLTDIPRRRSRRATSGVTTPQERLAEEPVEQEQPADDPDDPDSDDVDGVDADGTRAGRRRRRGGKGRRGRGTGADQGDDSTEDGQDGQDGRPTTQGGQHGQDGQEGTDGDSQPEDGGSADADGSQRQQAASGTASRRSRRGRRTTTDQGGDDTRTHTDSAAATEAADDDNGDTEDDGTGTAGTRRRRRRRRTGESAPPERSARDEVTSVRGSTRLEAKRQRRREGREAGRRRTIITEAEFLARRESVDRVMVVRGLEDRTQIAVLEDGVPVEHYVSRSAQSTMAGNVYLGRVQNVLPSMEAAFVDIGKGRNAVLYAGEVNWDAAGMSSGEPKRIENALKAGESVLVQVTKDPMGHKGARLTSQISLPGRYLVYVPGNSMTGISRKLPDTERARLKKILKEVVPDDAGVIVRTAAEGAAEAELRADVERLTATWERISGAAKAKAGSAPVLLHGEPDMTVRVIRDVFTEDFSKLVVSGDHAWTEVKRYIDDVAPDLADRVEKHTGTNDVFATHRVHEAISKAMDRKVWLPSGGSLVIDRTEAMTVVDVNTGKFTGSGGNLEETVTKNNIEAAEEIVRQLRLRDIGGIIVIDFIDMVLESNRDLVVRRLLECLGRDRTKHQVAEVTSLGLVQMTRKRVGSGLIEVFSESCAHCNGRGVVVQTEPVQRNGNGGSTDDTSSSSSSSRRGRGKGRSGSSSSSTASEPKNVLPPPNPHGPTPAQIAAAAHAAALQAGASSDAANAAAGAAATEVTAPEKAVARQAAVATSASPSGAAGDPGDPGADAPVVQDTAEDAPVQDAAASHAPTVPTVPTQDTPVEEAPAPDAPATGRGRRRAVAKSAPTKSAPTRTGARRAAARVAPDAPEGEGPAAEAHTASAGTDTPEPSTDTPEPSTATPEPVTATPEPVTATQDPAAAATEPAAEAPAAEAPAAAPKRRRRGRVVAPAGPPVGGLEPADAAEQAQS